MRVTHSFVSSKADKQDSTKARPSNWNADHVIEYDSGELINMKTFGAVGDGIADDTEAIQAAIDSIEGDGGGILFFPRGIYLISSRLTDAGTYPINILGAGIGLTIFKRSASFVGDLQLLEFSGDQSTFSNFTIDGNYGVAPASPYGEFSINGENQTFQYVETKNYDVCGMGSSGIFSKFDHCIATGNNTALGAGIMNFGIEGYQATGLTITNCIITQCGTNGIAVFNSGGGGQVIITNNVLDGNHVTGSEIVSGGGQMALIGDGFIVANNIITNGGGARTSGLELNGNDIQVVGNLIDNNGYGGIFIQAGTNHVVSGNTIKNSGTVSIPSPGISVNPDVCDFTISGNRCYDDRTPKYQTYGIEIAVGASDNYVVTNNNVVGNLTGGVSDGGTGINKVVEHNLDP